jgi:hypothetical protein
MTSLGRGLKNTGSGAKHTKRSKKSLERLKMSILRDENAYDQPEGGRILRLVSTRLAKTDPVEELSSAVMRKIRLYAPWGVPGAAALVRVGFQERTVLVLVVSSRWPNGAAKSFVLRR